MKFWALGSTRAVTNATGTVCFSADYYPYGQKNAWCASRMALRDDYTTSCSPTYKFTGYEYDSETGNYYAYARYYSPRLGRFMSPDPLGGNIQNPQSLNRYTYVLNNPESLVDPWGLCIVGTPPPDSASWSVTAKATTVRVVGYTVCSPDAARLEWDGSPFPGPPTPAPDTLLYYLRSPGNLPTTRPQQPQTQAPQQPRQPQQPKPPTLWGSVSRGAVEGALIGGAVGCVVGALPGSAVGAIFGGGPPGAAAGGMGGCVTVGLNGLVTGGTLGVVGGALDYLLFH